VTPDANAAHAFYGKTIGWKTQPWEEDSSYVMFAAPRGPIGATVAGDGAAPHWLPYIGTGDIDKTIALAKQNGGSVAKKVDTLSSGSRYAVLQDPYGASFGVYESAENYGKITPPKPGEHSWHELMSSDHDAAFDFYSTMFGWEKIGEHDMGDMGTYLTYGLNGQEFGGMMRVMDGGPASAWVSYVHVKDVNQTAKKVKSAGGQVINGPMEVPGGDWIVMAVDPQGAMFAAHASAASMKKPEKKMKPQQTNRPEQLTLAAESPPPIVQDPETPASEEAPPADQPSEAPAQKAPAKKRAPAKKAPAKEAPPATESPAEEAPAKQAPARKSPAKKAPAKKAPAKKAPAKKPSKAPAKKSGGAKKKSSKKRPAAKGAGSKKTAAKKGAKKSGGSPAKNRAKAKSKTRSGGNKKAVKKPRKGK
jgi:predicted enzyme related to lactoylglutathione lyase